jgi:ubiquinone/menaquinone biosynthesis C-methylase UbiE
LAQFEEIVLEHKNSLKRRIDEGSFVVVKKPKTPEEFVQWFRHLYAYKYASTLVHGKIVLDVRCGTGYGANELSATAQTVIGIDIWREGIIYCHSRYGDRASFIRASALNLPFRGNLFDLVTSFQVIEHIDAKMVNLYLEEIKRVLKNDGIFIVTTPNRKLRLLPFQKPWNPEHKKEYDAKEFDRTLKMVFKNSKVFGLFATEKAYLIEYYRVKQNPLFVYVLKPLFHIIKRFIPDFFLQALKRIMARKTDKSKNVGNQYEISIEDFELSSRKLKYCLDLYGICRK